MKWDVANIYFTLGDKTVRQTMGIPMGSPCSPALAVAVCMHAEHRFAEMHPEVVVHYGFRYIDDLLLFLRENSNLIGGIYLTRHPSSSRRRRASSWLMAAMSSGF